MTKLYFVDVSVNTDSVSSSDRSKHICPLYEIKRVYLTRDRAEKARQRCAEKLQKSDADGCAKIEFSVNCVHSAFDMPEWAEKIIDEKGRAIPKHAYINSIEKLYWVESPQARGRQKDIYGKHQLAIFTTPEAAGSAIMDCCHTLADAPDGIWLTADKGVDFTAGRRNVSFRIASGERPDWAIYAYIATNEHGDIQGDENDYIPAASLEDATWELSAYQYGGMIRRTGPEGYHEYSWGTEAWYETEEEAVSAFDWLDDENAELGKGKLVGEINRNTKSTPSIA